MPRKSKFTEEQIAYALKQTKAGCGLLRAYMTSDATKVDGRCVNYVEVPPEKWVAESNEPGAYVIRSVYSDQPECAEMWAKLQVSGDGAYKSSRHYLKETLGIE